MGKKNKFSINGSTIPLSINDEGEVAPQSVELGDDYSSADLTSRCGHEPDPSGNRHLRQLEGRWRHPPPTKFESRDQDRKKARPAVTPTLLALAHEVITPTCVAPRFSRLPCWVCPSAL